MRGPTIAMLAGLMIMIAGCGQIPSGTDGPGGSPTPTTGAARQPADPLAHRGEHPDALSADPDSVGSSAPTHREPVDRPPRAAPPRSRTGCP